MGWRPMYEQVMGEWRWVAIGMLILVLVAVTDLKMKRKKGTRAVPTPAGLLYVPWVGHLLQMILCSGGLPHRWFYELSRRRRRGGGGPLFMLWLGRIPVLVVSSAPAARLVLQEHDIAFASRSSTPSAVQTLFYGPSDLAFSPYGPYWRKVKELLMTNLFSSTKIQAFAPVRAQELSRLISSISAHGATPQLIRPKVFDMAFDNVSRMSLGRTARDLSPDFIKVSLDTLDLLGAFNIGDFLPAIRWLDLQGYERRIKATRGKIDEILQPIIDDRRKELETGKKDGMNSDNPRIFLDVLLTDFDHGIDGSKAKDDCIKEILLESYMVTQHQHSHAVHKEKYLKPLIFHDGSLVKRPTKLLPIRLGLPTSTSTPSASTSSALAFGLSTSVASAFAPSTSVAFASAPSASKPSACIE